jgi:hypothetical protein
VHDELHAAALIEEALEDDAFLRRDGSQGAAPGLDVLGDLDRGTFGQGVSTFGLKKREFLRRRRKRRVLRR